MDNVADYIFVTNVIPPEVRDGVLKGNQVEGMEETHLVRVCQE